jgi:hypothetical protein
MILVACGGFCWFLLTGCSYTASIYGLRPVSPPVKMGAMFSSDNGRLVYPVMDFVSPRFEWQPFVPPESLSGAFASPTNITYDLRIWKIHNDSPADLVYERKALPAPQHKLQHPLEPGTRYFWSVRARFEIQGETRLADWSRSLHPYNLQHLADIPSPIPAANYFRFITSGY